MHSVYHKALKDVTNKTKGPQAFEEEEGLATSGLFCSRSNININVT